MHPKQSTTAQYQNIQRTTNCIQNKSIKAQLPHIPMIQKHASKTRASQLNTKISKILPSQTCITNNPRRLGRVVLKNLLVRARSNNWTCMTHGMDSFALKTGITWRDWFHGKMDEIYEKFTIGGSWVGRWDCQLRYLIFY